MTNKPADHSAEGHVVEHLTSDKLRKWREQLAMMTSRPQDFDFWQALRRLECLSSDKPRFGTALSPRDESVRLGQEATFDFAATNWTACVRDTNTEVAHLRQRVFGLLGPNGPLPLHITEFTHELLFGDQEEKKLGEELRAFLDILIQRPILQFYRAWAQGQPVVGLDRKGDDPFALYIASLCGEVQLRAEGLDGVPRSRRLHFAGWLGRVVRSPEGLAAWLSGGLGVPVRVSTFQPHWILLEDDQRTRLSASIGRSVQQGLSRGATLGSRVWDVQHKFRLTIGPLSALEYDDFLPRFRSLSPGGKLRQLRAMVRRYIGQEFAWDLRLELFSRQARRVILGRRPQAGDPGGLTASLGYGAWLGRGPRAKDMVSDLLLEPETYPAG